MPNYFQIIPVVFEKKIFKDFYFGCLGNQNSAWNGFFLTLKGDRPRIISVKFGEIPLSVLGNVVFVDKCLMDGLS